MVADARLSFSFFSFSFLFRGVNAQCAVALDEPSGCEHRVTTPSALARFDQRLWLLGWSSGTTAPAPSPDATKTSPKH
eukprot:3931795-Rhodomonas_salina.1